CVGGLDTTPSLLSHLGPAAVDKLFASGLTAYQAGEWTQARYYLNMLLRLQSDYMSKGWEVARLRLLAELFEAGLVAYERGQWVEARDALSEALRLGPGY